MISSLAYINSSATIGNNVTIDPFAVIEANVVIGDGCHIMSHAVIMEATIIGKGCKVFPSAVIGAIPQDLKYAGEKPNDVIGDNNTISECVTINRGNVDRVKTVAGIKCSRRAYGN